MLRKRLIRRKTAKKLQKVYCPLCKSRNVDPEVFGEAGKFECLKCQVIFSIEAIKKKPARA